APVVAGPLEPLPHAAERLDLLPRSLATRGRERLVEPRTVLVAERADLRLVELPIGDEPLAVDLPHRGMVPNALVHHRLGERRIVELVVAVPAIADQVDEDVAAELLPVAHG